MNFGFSLKYFQSQLQKPQELKLPDQPFKTFFINGFKLGTKYLGSKHIMTQKLKNLCQTKKVAQTAPELTPTEDEEKKAKKNGFLKKSFNLEKDLTSYYSQSQSSIHQTDENTFDEFENNPRSFRIRPQSYNKKFSSKKNNYFEERREETSNKYLKQIKDLEETLFDIRKIREFYEQEKRILEEQQIKKQAEQTYLMNPYLLPINNPVNPINMQHNNPLLTAPNNNYIFPPPNHHQGYYSGFQNVSSVSPMPQNGIDQINSKQHELEEKLLNLKKENEEILKEKFLKQQELNDLKKMVYEMKEQKPKARRNSTPREATNDDEKILPDDIQNENGDQNSYLDFNGKNLNDANAKKSNNPAPKEKNKHWNEELNKMESPEKLKSLTAVMKNLEQEQNGKNNKAPKQPLFKPVESVTLKNEGNDPRNLSKANKQAPDPQINKAQSKGELIAENNSAVFNNPNKNGKKKSLRFDEKNIIPRSEQAIPPNNNKKLLNNDENDKKNIMKMPSMEFMSENLNPGSLIQYLLPSFPRNLPIKRKLFLDSKVFSIECHIIDEGNSPFFILKGFNDDSKSKLNEEKIPAAMFSKILRTIDVKDILPYEVPLKTIENYESFMKYFVMPFIGVFIF